MAKIVLGRKPKSFKRVVSFPMLDGEDGSIECTFKYRTRREFGDFFDTLFAETDEKPSADGKFSMADLMGKTSAKNAEYLLKVLDGWNLDEEISKATLEQLSDEVPSAVTAIMEAYRLSILEGRLGN